MSKFWDDLQPDSKAWWEKRAVEFLQSLEYSLSCRDCHYYGCVNQRRDREGCRRGNAGQDACVLWTARTKDYRWSVAREP